MIQFFDVRLCVTCESKVFSFTKSINAKILKSISKKRLREQQKFMARFLWHNHNVFPYFPSFSKMYDKTAKSCLEAFKNFHEMIIDILMLDELENENVNRKEFLLLLKENIG